MFSPELWIVNWREEPYYRQKARYKLPTAGNYNPDSFALSVYQPTRGAIRGKRIDGLEGRLKITRLPVTDSTLDVSSHDRAA